MRLNKFISHSGYCSRRKADELISTGKVMINNVPVKELGSQVDPEVDVIRIKNGPELQLEKETTLLLFHKPKGYICTKHDDHADRTVYDLLPEKYQSFNTIGRLDKDSEGLLLFTNNGEFAHQLGHPKFGKSKVYQVSVKGKVTEKDLDKIRKGMRLLEYSTAPAQATMMNYSEKDNRTDVEIVLKEGKKRQIRNMFLALKKPVKKLVRIQFGKYRLGSLKPGEIKIIPVSDKS